MESTWGPNKAKYVRVIRIRNFRTVYCLNLLDHNWIGSGFNIKEPTSNNYHPLQDNVWWWSIMNVVCFLMQSLILDIFSEIISTLKTSCIWLVVWGQCSAAVLQQWLLQPPAAAVRWLDERGDKLQPTAVCCMQRCTTPLSHREQNWWTFYLLSGKRSISRDLCTHFQEKLKCSLSHTGAMYKVSKAGLS